MNDKLLRETLHTAKSHAALPDKVFEKFIESVPENTFKDLRDKTIYRILYDTGFRVSEVASLTIESLTPEMDGCYFRRAKNHKKMYGCFSPQTQQCLIRYLQMRKELITDSLSLFVGLRKGGGCHPAISTRTIQRSMKERMEAIGIEGTYTPHSMRHGLAHRMIAKGATLLEVSIALGHTEPNSSMRYAQLSREEHKRQQMKYM